MKNYFHFKKKKKINTNVIFFKIFLYNSLLQISTITKTNFVLLLLLFFFLFWGVRVICNYVQDVKINF
jgi:hypothetical protein